MENRWNVGEAPSDLLGQLVYGSRVFGSQPDLVLHGGGNSSVKATARSLTGEILDVLYIKGSGSDLATIEPAGFPAVAMREIVPLLGVSRLADSAMMNALRAARLDTTAPDPSVETLLHADLPYPAVLHSHADAIVTLTNTPGGRAIIEAVYADDVVVIPYVMPGFDLAALCAVEFPAQAHAGTLGMVLLCHGLFTFGRDMREAYDRHIELVTRAERYLDESVRRGRFRGAGPGPQGPSPIVASAPAPAARPEVTPAAATAEEIARLRLEVSRAAGAPMVLLRTDTADVRAFVSREDLTDVALRGPATPDHVIRTKRIPLIGRDVTAYAADYAAYFERLEERGRVPLTMLDPAPRVILDPGLGMLCAGRRPGDAVIARDIYRHTIGIISDAEELGGWVALPESDVFDVEYWELEQAKLKRAALPPLAGEVALITGAASGIGRGCARALRALGAAIVAVDLQHDEHAASGPDYLAVEADVTEKAAVEGAVRAAIDAFGGIDIAVISAGVFPASQPIASLALDEWDRAMSVNARGVALLLSALHPILKLAPRYGRVALIASKNVPAPGPGAAAYSASKAAAAQLARVAALEWASDGIRVNMVHPDAVFDTGLWTPSLLQERAAHYGLSVEDYKRRNLLRAEITSRAVGDLVATICGDAFAVTTGAQIPIDGGNERVI